MVRLNPFRRKPKVIRTSESEKVHSVPGVLLESRKGFSTLKKISAESGEILVSDKESIYTGIIPAVLEISSSIIPSKIARLFVNPKWRARMHFRLFDQPFTRDIFSGKILDPEKKEAVLKERGFMDEEGFLLKEAKGERFEIEGCYVKVDVSDIDYIKSEWHSYFQSKNNERMAAAMAKTGRDMDRWFFYTIIAFGVIIMLIVFMMSGGVSGIVPQ